MKVKYFVREGKSDRPFINVRITCGRKLDVRKALPLTIVRKYWSEDGTIKGRHLPPQIESVRTKLSEFENAVQTAYTNTLTTHEPLSLRWVENIIENFFTGAKKQEGYEYLTDYMEELVNDLSFKLVPRGGGKRYTPNTRKNYASTLSRLREFEGKRKIRLADVDLSFHESFLNYCHNDLELGINTISNYVKNIKSTLKKAEKEGVRVCQDYKSEDFYRPRRDDPKTGIYLTESELNNLWSYDIESESLKNTRDWLIISCETGLRISDLLTPSEQTIEAFDYALGELKEGRSYDSNEIGLKLIAQKTGNTSSVPLLKRSAEILLKHKGLPRSISDVNYNIYVKDLCKLVGIDKRVFGSKVVDIGDKRFRKRSGYFPKYELVSSHIGRRTYITNAYLKGVDPISIMKVSGHKSLDQLEEYIKMTSEDSFESLQRMHLNNRNDVPTRMEVEKSVA